MANANGWHERHGEWTVASKPRIATVSDFGGFLMLFAGVSTEATFEPVMELRIDTPSQLLDAMIRADRFVAEGGA